MTQARPARWCSISLHSEPVRFHIYMQAMLVEFPEIVFVCMKSTTLSRDVCSFAVPGSSISVFGNTLKINSGKLTYLVNDGTDFGSIASATTVSPFVSVLVSPLASVNRHPFLSKAC